MNKRTLTLTLSSFLLAFYACIVLYAFFTNPLITHLSNFIVALVFEVIGFGLLCCFALMAIIIRSVRTAYTISLGCVTGLYTLLLHTLTFAGALVIPARLFILFQLILLFVYCLVSIPMYIVGRK